MAKLTKEERSWVLYDWANSAYSITVTTAVFPLFFGQMARQGGLFLSLSGRSLETTGKG